MKDAIKLVVRHYQNGERTYSKETWKCGYCESGFVYYKKKTNTIFCRDCGKESKIDA